MLCYFCFSPCLRGYSSGTSRCSADTPENGQTRFTFLELATATEKFSSTNLIGEGGFGKVYKGCLRTGKTVAIKLLDRDGIQGDREFVTEVLLLSVLDHSNLVKLIGYCNDGDSRGLVYEYISGGSLDNHLFDVTQGQRILEWNKRVEIAFGVAQGLEYLHYEVDPPVIHRDLKGGNILLDENFSPKLSDFGLAKLGPVGDKSHVTTRVMGTNGYCAPEYMKTGKLTRKSDVFSFGVLLLELITGRRSIDLSRRRGEQNLVVWARPLFNEPKELVDPLLQGRFSFGCLRRLLAVTRMCLNEEPNYRPLIREVLVELEYLASPPCGRGVGFRHAKELSF